MAYIVELEPGVWLADLEGDPGRTCQKKSAQGFEHYYAASVALLKARTFRPFKRARIERVEPGRGE